MRSSVRKYLKAGVAKGKKALKEGDDHKYSHGGYCSSTATATSSSSSCSEYNGALDPKQQLVEAYGSLLKDGAVEEAWRKEFFQQVRILVIGRSGAGKTTLIRLMVGKEGPHTISEDVAGVQDINKEFLYSSEEEGVPLLIHDSNGMDVKGKERVDEIKFFLDKHQKEDNFANHVHMVWYVVSAIDPRCIEDGDVMKLIGRYKIPLLLIMTHNDYVKVKLKDTTLSKLLEGYGSEEERENVKKMMVKVGNDGVTIGDNNELIINETMRDREGLRLVARRTKQLIDKRLRYTWVAAQAVDIDGKLEESARLIASFARRAFLTSFSGVVPFVDPLKLSIIFYRVTVIMCQIWLVPQNLREALKETLLVNEGGTRVLRRVGKDMLRAAGLVVTLATTVATIGETLPLVIAFLTASGLFHVGKSLPILVKTFSLQVLATIVYVKSTHIMSSKYGGWKPAVSKEKYVKLCEDFSHNAEYQRLLQKFAREDHSTLDTVLHKKKVKGIIKSKVLEIYRRLLHDFPNSVFSLLPVPTNGTDSSDDELHITSLTEESNVLEVDEENNNYDELDKREFVVVYT